MRNYRYLLSLLLAATVVLAACGSDSQATDTVVTLPNSGNATDQDNADNNTDGETSETLGLPPTPPTEENGDDGNQDGEDQANADSGDDQDGGDQGDNNGDQGDDQNQQDDQTGDDQPDNSNGEDQTGSTDGDTGSETDTGSENSGDTEVGQVDYLLRGTITADGDGAIPEGAVVKVSLHNTSERQSSDTEVISATYTDVTSFPIDYELAWTGSNLGNIKLNYVSATVTLDGKVIYDTESVIDVSPQESVVDFSVVKV